jgi:hypothetical protein
LDLPEPDLGLYEPDTPQNTTSGETHGTEHEHTEKS